MIDLLQTCLLIALARPAYTSPLSGLISPSALLSPLPPNNSTNSFLTLNAKGPCPAEPPAHYSTWTPFHDIVMWLRPGPAADPKIMTDLLQYGFNEVEQLIDVHGENGTDPVGVYHYTLWNGLILHIEADYAATIATLDYGRVADVIEYLIKYNVEGRRFCLMAGFEVSFKKFEEPFLEEDVIGSGRLWTH